MNDRAIFRILVLRRLTPRYGRLTPRYGVMVCVIVSADNVSAQMVLMLHASVNMRADIDLWLCGRGPHASPVRAEWSLACGWGRGGIVHGS